MKEKEKRGIGTRLVSDKNDLGPGGRIVEDLVNLNHGWHPNGGRAFSSFMEEGEE